jgi:hypothetical protein
VLLALIVDAEGVAVTVGEGRAVETTTLEVPFAVA